jgi:outer membrane protein OmpA-like peptidoglycan-associated protein
VGEGLEADRFEVQGFGEAKPIVPNDSRENKQRNRRVELTILD